MTANDDAEAAAAPPAPPSPAPLLPLRTALVLLMAFVVGTCAGALSYLSNPDAPGAVLVGCGSVGAAVILFHTLLGR